MPLPLYTLAHLLTMFRKVCDAMPFAHSKGIIHRDLKLENIMVGDLGEVLVMDWGLAKALDGAGAARSDGILPSPMAGSHRSLEAADGASMSRTLDGSVMGAPQYMSPEQAGLARQLWPCLQPDEKDDKLLSAVITPDGKRIVCSRADGSFLILSAKDGALLRELKPQPELTYPDTIAMTPDGKMIVAGNNLERGDRAVVGGVPWDGQRAERDEFQSRRHAPRLPGVARRRPRLGAGPPEIGLQTRARSRSG